MINSEQEKSKKFEEICNQFIKACFNLIPGEDTLEVILTALMRQFECNDPLPLLKMCLFASECFHLQNDSMHLNLSEFITKLSHFNISMVPQYRIISRDILLSLYGLQLPIEQTSLIFLAPNLLRACILSLTPAVSSVPRTI